MASTPLARNAAFWGAVIIAGFNALSAVSGGIGMLVTGGLGMPMEALEGSPFTSFALPALVLIAVVGGTQSLATGPLIARRESALLWSGVAGLGMLIWIFVETVVIRGGSWLQVLYFATGTLQIALVLALLGVVAWLPRRPLRRAALETEVESA